VIGFQARVTEVEGVEYEWREYVLFNPFKGFRYLSEYNGHWNDIIPVKGLPKETTHKGRRAAQYLGTTYQHFQSTSAQTTYVMGEFPWRAQVRDVVFVHDFIRPPQMLSSEVVENEVTWSMGEYMTGEEVWKAFSLPGSPPAATGVFANQPAPKRSIKGVWMLWLLLTASLLAVASFSAGLMSQTEVFRQRYSFESHSPEGAAFVTDIFELKGRPSNVEIGIQTDLDQDWAYFSFALINADTGIAYDFGREVSYFYGRDSDGSWSEGGRNDEVVISAIPAGRYYLRVEPSMDRETPVNKSRMRTMHYELRVRRDVPVALWYGIAFVALLIPPIIISFRSGGFERARWAESDYGS
jgi:hypothetical protein